MTGFSQHPTWYRSPGVYQYSYTYPSAPYYRANPSYYPSYYYPSTGFSFYYSTPGITLGTYPYYPYYYGTNTYYGYPRYGTYVYPQVYTYPYGVYPVPGYGYRRP